MPPPRSPNSPRLHKPTTTHEHAVQLLKESSQLEVHSLTLLAQAQVVTTFLHDKVVPEEDGTLAVGIIGVWVQFEAQSCHHFRFPLNEFFPPEGLFGNGREGALSSFSGNYKTCHCHPLVFLHLHSASPFQIEVGEGAGQHAGLSKKPLFGAFSHEGHPHSLHRPTHTARIFSVMAVCLSILELSLCSA